MGGRKANGKAKRAREDRAEPIHAIVADTGW